MVKAWKTRINVVKGGLCPNIQLTECEGVWPRTVSVGRQSGGEIGPTVSDYVRDLGPT